MLHRQTKQLVLNMSPSLRFKFIKQLRCLSTKEKATIEYRELLKSYTNSKTSYASSVSEFPLVTNSVRELLTEKAASLPNSVCHAFPFQGVDLTFGQLHERVNVAAQNLLAMGFLKGDRIAIALPNSFELLITTLAASYIGAVTILLNPAYQMVELEYMLKKTGAKGLVIYDSFKVLKHMQLIQKLCPEIETAIPGELNSKLLPALKHVIVLNSPLVPEKKTYKGTWTFAEINKSRRSGYELPFIDLDDPFLILFTVSRGNNFEFLINLFEKILFLK